MKDEAEGQRTPAEHARAAGLPMLDAAHPIYSCGYVIGGRRLKASIPNTSEPKTVAEPTDAPTQKLLDLPPPNRQADGPGPR
jgi:hypothetical protein